MVWDFCNDVSSGHYPPHFDAEKLRHRQSSSLHMPVTDFEFLPNQQFLQLDGSGTSGSVYYREEESVVPSHSIPSPVEVLHVGQQELHFTSLELDDLLTSHGWSDGTDPHKLFDLWNNFPLYSCPEEMVAASPATVGWGEGSSPAHVSGHETVTSTMMCCEGKSSQGGCGDPILRDGSRLATELDDNRQLEALLKAAVPSKLENKGREIESAFISESPSENSTPTECFQLEAASLAKTRCTVATPTSTSVFPPTTLRKTTKASREVRPKSACAVVQASCLSNRTFTASPLQKILPRLNRPNASMLDGLQPTKVLKRGVEVEVNFPEIKQTEAKPLRSKHRKEYMDHVEKERQRRAGMSGKLAKLEDLLPASTGKRDRVTIFGDAVQHITRLQQEVRVLKEKHHILAAAKRKAEVSKDPVKIPRSVNPESAARDIVPFLAASKAMKSMDTCRKPMSTLPRLGITKMCKQRVPDVDSLTISPEQSVDGDNNKDRKIVTVEFHMQVDSAIEQAPDVIRCQCKVNYLSSTMRTLEDMKLDVRRCSITKMEDYVMCVLLLKTRSNVSNYKLTEMTTQFAARLKYNQVNFELQSKQ